MILSGKMRDGEGTDCGMWKTVGGDKRDFRVIYGGKGRVSI